MKTSKLKQIITAEAPKQTVSRSNLLNSGFTMLNLACTDLPFGAYPKGKYIFMVGDSFAGKTIAALTAGAETRRSKRFKHYRIIFDDSEDGDIMAKAAFFGSKLEQCIEPPKGDQDDPIASFTAEDFYDYLDDKFNDDEPFIYIKDSENSLATLDDIKKVKKQRAARQAQAKEAGSFGTSKAKIHSTRLRIARGKLRKTGSMLFILAQTRDRIGFGAQFDPKTRSGGNALKFFADIELWFSIKGQITKTIRGIKRQQGIIAQIKIKKNRINGKLRTVLMPIYNTAGIDDVGGMILWLAEEKHWKWGGDRESKGIDLSRKITAPEFNFTGPYETLVRKIQDGDHEQKLRDIVVGLWNDIEQACVVQRKRRYT